MYTLKLCVLLYRLSISWTPLIFCSVTFLLCNVRQVTQFCPLLNAFMVFMSMLYKKCIIQLFGANIFTFLSLKSKQNIVFLSSQRSSPLVRSTLCFSEKSFFLWISSSKNLLTVKLLSMSQLSIFFQFCHTFFFIPLHPLKSKNLKATNASSQPKLPENFIGEPRNCFVFLTNNTKRQMCQERWHSVGDYTVHV